MDTINRLETWGHDMNQDNHDATLAELSMAQDVLRHMMRLNLPPEAIGQQLAVIAILELELTTYAL